MRDEEMKAAVGRIAQVFSVIKTAAMLLEAIEPQRLLDSWDRQESILPFTDPTLMQELILSRDDLARKKRLLTAARDFMVAWNAVKVEALSSVDKPRPGRGLPGRGLDEEDAPGNEEGS